MIGGLLMEALKCFKWLIFYYPSLTPVCHRDLFKISYRWVICSNERQSLSLLFCFCLSADCLKSKLTYDIYGLGYPRAQLPIYQGKKPLERGCRVLRGVV